MTAAYSNTDDVSPHRATTVIDCGGADFRVSSSAAVTVISIIGAIDAANIDDVSRHARRLVPACGALVLDVADIDFIAVEGLHMLFVLKADCDRTDIVWSLIASHAVSRLLRVGDHNKLLPAVASAPDAFASVRRGSRGRQPFRLVGPA